MADAVTERCDQLRLLGDQPLCTEADKANIAAVIRDYEGGMPIPGKGNGILYFGGRKMTEEIPLEGLSLVDKINEWKDADPGGRIFVEKIPERKFLFAASMTYPRLCVKGHNAVWP